MPESFLTLFPYVSYADVKCLGSWEILFSTELQLAFFQCIPYKLLAGHKESLGNSLGVDNSHVSILLIDK